ncbi:MAG: cytochrome c, partial [Novosphingobium sp.]
MNRNSVALLATALGLMTASVVAGAASPANTIAARQANFKVMGKSFKAIMDQMKAPTADFAVIKNSADNLAKAATKVHGFFPKGTGPEAGVKTHALPAIWEKPAEFKLALGKLVDGTKAMQKAAKTNDIAAVKAAFPGAG